MGRDRETQSSIKQHRSLISVTALIIACVHVFDGTIEVLSVAFVLTSMSSAVRFFNSLSQFIFLSPSCFFSISQRFNTKLKRTERSKNEKHTHTTAHILLECLSLNFFYVHIAHDMPFQRFHSPKRNSLARIGSVSANCIICQVSCCSTAIPLAKYRKRCEWQRKKKTNHMDQGKSGLQIYKISHKENELDNRQTH